MKHFGVCIKERLYSTKLIRDEYARIDDDKESFDNSFVDVLLVGSTILSYPKDEILPYLNEVKKYYNSLDKLSSKLRNNLNDIRKWCKILDTPKAQWDDKLISFFNKAKEDSFTLSYKDIKERQSHFDFEKSIEGRRYSDAYCKELYDDAMYNYDLNMKYFSSLSQKDFNKQVDDFLKKNDRFYEIFDLNSYKNVSGIYVMILDEYKQVYVGVASDIYKRIRQHWTKHKPLDRLVFGSIDSSKLSIDSFRALDTTRILVMADKSYYDSEDKYIRKFNKKYVLNRITGGFKMFGFAEAIDSRIKHKLL